MAYSFQTFTTGQVLTAVQMNQIEANVRDHTHGSSGVNANFVSFVGSALTANSLSAHNAVVNSSFNAKDQIYHHTTERLNVYYGRVSAAGSAAKVPSHPVTWTTSYDFSPSPPVYVVTHSLGTANYTPFVHAPFAGASGSRNTANIQEVGSNSFKYSLINQTASSHNYTTGISYFSLALD